MYRDYLRPTGGAVNGTNALMRLGVRCSLAVIANRLYDDPFNSYPQGLRSGMIRAFSAMPQWACICSR